MPTNCNKTFWENLVSIYRNPYLELTQLDSNDFIEHVNSKKLLKKPKIIKINIPSELHEEVLHSLKQMNITAETLFPGIDGLAKSLQQSHIRL